jgi:hypothetical protein
MSLAGAQDKLPVFYANGEIRRISWRWRARLACP